MGPFVVEKRVGSVAYKLALPPRFKGLHPVFHVSLLKAHRGPLPVRPDPVSIEGEPEFEVERIVGHRVRRGQLQY